MGILHKEMLNYTTFPLLQESELSSSLNQIIVAMSYGIQILQTCKDNLQVINIVAHSTQLISSVHKIPWLTSLIGVGTLLVNTDANQNKFEIMKFLLICSWLARKRKEKERKKKF